MRMKCSEDSDPNWITVLDQSHEAAMDWYFRENLRFYDSDNGGDDTYFFGFSDANGTKYYEMLHDWSIYYDPDWNLEHITSVKEIDAETAKKGGITTDRDWLRV